MSNDEKQQEYLEELRKNKQQMVSALTHNHRDMLTMPLATSPYKPDIHYEKEIQPCGKPRTIRVTIDHSGFALMNPIDIPCTCSICNEHYRKLSEKPNKAKSP